MNYLDQKPRMFHGGRVSNTVLHNTMNRGYAVGGSVAPYLSPSPKPSPVGGKVPLLLGPSPKPSPVGLPSPSAGPLRSMLMHAMGQRGNTAGIQGLLPMGQQNSPFIRSPQRPYGTRGFAGGGPAYIDQGTGANGREDNIPADLSENEYVIDAETVALLGDGNPDAGAAKLDQMRENIRRHKGAALASGEISEDALDPLEYCDGGITGYAGGGRVSNIESLVNKLSRHLENNNHNKARQTISKLQAKHPDITRADLQDLLRMRGSRVTTDEDFERALHGRFARVKKADGGMAYAGGGRVGKLLKMVRGRKPLTDLDKEMEKMLERAQREFDKLPPHEKVGWEDIYGSMLDKNGDLPSDMIPPRKKAGGGRITSLRKLLDLNDPALADEAADVAYKDSVSALKRKLQSTKTLDLNDPTLPSRKKDIGRFGPAAPELRKIPNAGVEEILMRQIPNSPAGKTQMRDSLHRMILEQKRRSDRLRALQRLSEITGDGPVSDMDLEQYLKSFSGN